jgi:hypothetical protein
MKRNVRKQSDPTLSSVLPLSVAHFTLQKVERNVFLPNTATVSEVTILFDIHFELQCYIPHQM